MSKKNHFLLIFLILLVFFYSFKIDLYIDSFIKNFTLNIQKSLIFKVNYLSNYYLNLHKLNNINKKLKQEVSQLKKTQILNKIYKNKILQYERMLSLKPIENDLILVEAISYINFDNFSSIFLDLELNTTKYILPLFDINGYASGIIVKKNNKFIGLLNNNKKSNYAVFIGKKNAPGITTGYKNGLLKIQFVPIIYKINIGDLVITSGLDNIFPLGIEVGKVKKIKKDNQTQIIYVKPISNINSKYFYTLN